MKNNNKKIVFNEEIDSSISGFALVFAFILIGVFLQFNSSFFSESNTLIKIIFVIFGILGFFTEMNNLNLKFRIKGIDNIGIGIVLLVVLYVLYITINFSKWYKIFIGIYELVFFIFLLLAIYAVFAGLLQMAYSLYQNYKSNEHKKRKVFSSLIVILTQIASLILILTQIYDICFK